MSNDGVHAAHCCRLHGCKYGDEDCPVASGAIKQEYTCEDCDYDLEDCDPKREGTAETLELIELLNKVRETYRSLPRKQLRAVLKNVLELITG